MQVILPFSKDDFFVQARWAEVWYSVLRHMGSVTSVKLFAVFKGMVIFWLSAFVLTACSAGQDAHQTRAANGDLREETVSVHELPSFLDGQSEGVRLVYQAAALSNDLLERIPCYCGCGKSAGHQSSLHCFVHAYREDGSVIWDDHGTRCGVCLEIAAESIRLRQEGKSVQEIREYIDEKYRDGYAEPTPTPMPS